MRHSMHRFKWVYTLVVGVLFFLLTSVLLTYFFRTIQIESLFPEYKNSFLSMIVSSYKSVDLANYAPMDREAFFLGDNKRLSLMQLLSKENMFDAGDLMMTSPNKQQLDFFYKSYVENTLPLSWKGGIQNEQGFWEVCQINYKGETFFVKENQLIEHYLIQRIHRDHIQIQNQETKKCTKLFFNKRSYFAPPEAVICYIMSEKDRVVHEGDVVSGMIIEAISSTYLVMNNQGEKVFVELVPQVEEEEIKT